MRQANLGYWYKPAGIIIVRKLTEKYVVICYLSKQIKLFIMLFGCVIILRFD